MQKAFPGRAFVRGILLFPYVAPVIAVAFSWVILFDPFSGSVNAMMLELGVVKEPIKFFWTALRHNWFAWTRDKISCCSYDGNYF